MTLNSNRPLTHTVLRVILSESRFPLLGITRLEVGNSLKRTERERIGP
jgi:hypothetical protein